MIQFSKKELEVLPVFSSFADTGSQFADKIFIVAEGGRCFLFQESTYATLIYFLDKKVEGDQKFSYEIPKLNSLLNSCKSSDTITFTDDFILINDKSKYELSQFDGVCEYSNYFDCISNIGNWNKFSIEDQDKLKQVKPYISQIDPELKGIAMVSNYFIATDRYNITYALKGKGQGKGEPLVCVPSSVVSLINSITLNSLDLYTDKDYNGNIVQVSDNFFVFLTNVKEIVIPNIFSEAIQEVYNHPDTVTFNKKDLLEVFNKMLIVTNDKLNHRVYLSFDTKSIVIECKDDYYGKDSISTISDIPDVLLLKSFIVSAYYLKTILLSLKSEKVQIHFPSDPEREVAILVRNADNEDQLYIHNLYINYEGE